MIRARNVSYRALGRTLVDDVSLAFVRGATVDYVEEMIRSSFVIGDNPNAESGCGCGVSFAAK